MSRYRQENHHDYDLKVNKPANRLQEIIDAIAPVVDKFGGCAEAGQYLIVDTNKFKVVER